MDANDMTGGHDEKFGPFNPATAEAGKLYLWDEMNEKGMSVIALQPTHVTPLGILAAVCVADEDDDARIREVRAVQAIFLPDGDKGYAYAETIPMGKYTSAELRKIADDYSRAAAFLESIEQD
ncbi:hypothetical protein HKX69_12340 [Streptomyces argyrophyllae]|uniref:Uncharacterized protein n=1 Tax=Streptomyces argyrophylli TaxID=2726118 RepID=A0A6M4PJF6_9ACTN|nr:hypothetical protein [Streptomyces argyrophyllae]QJS10213.1 hypothetical protein HKX69_12340 [Streptomyces argyrophyllae]